MKQWKAIQGFNDVYYCSTDGEIKSVDHKNTRGYLRKGKILKQSKDTSGYLGLRLSIQGMSKRYLSHRLIALTFIPNPQNLEQVNHINGIKTDNRVQNLEWVDRSANCKHSFLIGLQCNKGENHPGSKIKKVDVLRIRELHKQGVSAYKIKDLYDISYTQVKDIIKRRSWSHI